MKSAAVGAAFAMDNLLDYSWYVEQLLARKQPVLVYAGEFDAQDGPKSQEHWLRKLQFDGSSDFWKQSRNVYYINQPGQDEQIVGGYWRTGEYLHWLTVPKAGHFVPANNYQASF